MTSTQTDVIAGLSTSLAIKAPVRCVVTALPGGVGTGLPLVTTVGDGDVQLAENDRVLYAPPIADVKTGIYDAHSGLWTRSPDADGARDLTHGTRVFTWSNALWGLVTPNPITIGTTPMLWSVVSLVPATFSDIGGLPAPSMVKSRRLVAVAAGTSAFGYDYTQVNGNIMGITADGSGGGGGINAGAWAKSIGVAGKLDVLAPVFWTLGDSQAYFAAAVADGALVWGPMGYNVVNGSTTPGGGTSTQHIAAFPANLAALAGRKPHIVFLSTGTHDPEGTGMPLDQTKANILTMIGLIKAAFPDTNIVMMGTPPWNSYALHLANWTVLKALSEWAERVLPLYGVTFFNAMREWSVDYNGGNWLWKNTLQMAAVDGLHTAVAGYRALALEVARRGVPLFIKSMSIVAYRNDADPPGTVPPVFDLPRVYEIDWNATVSTRHDVGAQQMVAECEVPQEFGVLNATLGKAVAGGIGFSIDIIRAVGDSGLSCLSAVFLNFDSVPSSNRAPQKVPLPMLRMLSTANQALASAPLGVVTQLAYALDQNDDKDFFFTDATLGQVTIRRAGNYDISVGVHFNAFAAGQRSVLGIVLNGATALACVFGLPTAAATILSQSCSVQAKLAVGDVISAVISVLDAASGAAQVSHAPGVLPGIVASAHNHLTVARRN